MSLIPSSQWEDIGLSNPRESECGNTFRMKVPGGWIVRTESYIMDPYGKGKIKFNMMSDFVVDPDHEWTINKKETE